MVPLTLEGRKTRRGKMYRGVVSKLRGNGVAAVVAMSIVSLVRTHLGGLVRATPRRVPYWAHARASRRRRFSPVFPSSASLRPSSHPPSSASRFFVTPSLAVTSFFISPTSSSTLITSLLIPPPMPPFRPFSVFAALWVPSPRLPVV